MFRADQECSAISRLWKLFDLGEKSKSLSGNSIHDRCERFSGAGKGISGAELNVSPADKIS